MLSKEDWMEIKAQIEQGVYQKDIAEALGVHPKTVSRALKRQRAPSGRRSGVRKSKLDPFKPAVDEFLRVGVWNTAVIFRELQARGYPGGRTILRQYVHPKRTLRKSPATVRFETEPGRQTQSDWGETVTWVGGKLRKVHFSVNTLGFSRRFHFWCTDREDAEHSYEGIIRAFEHFGGVTREVLVDNHKSAVIEHRIGEQVRFNARFLDLAGCYGFTPRACRPYRARTKGKDERMVGYIKNHFFVRWSHFESLDHMNQLALRWLEEEADRRVQGTVKEVVLERFHREAPFLGPLPAARYDTSYREQRFVGWDGYIDVRGNRYSVPSEFCGSPVAIRISLEGRLSVYAGDLKVADHRLRDAAEGWQTVPEHHEKLWRDTMRVERRDLAVYEEVARCNC